MPLTRRAFLPLLAAPGGRAQTIGGIAYQPWDWRDLRPAAARELERLGVNPATYRSWQHELSRETARREQEGEWDHVIFYVLQSQQFTREPRIEPALSAREFVATGKVPVAVRRRYSALLQTGPVFRDPAARIAAAPGPRKRLDMVLRIVLAAADPALELDQHYRRAMQALFNKEFGGGDPQAFYEARGHSTDTQVAANYAVWTGLSVLRLLSPALRVERALILGPGLDLAPRTALFDEVAPQSFQPYLAADALLSTGLSTQQPEIRCWDINHHVNDFINEFPRFRRVLELYTAAGDSDYNRYFEQAGAAVGECVSVPPHGTLRRRTVTVRRTVAQAVSCSPVNVLTAVERPRRGPYDLTIATNVLLYYRGPELLIALANFTEQLRPGGYLMCNDTRPEVERLLGVAGLRPVQARILPVAGNLTDAFAIFQKQ